jgi:hypothetical protein
MGNIENLVAQYQRNPGQLSEAAKLIAEEYLKVHRNGTRCNCPFHRKLAIDPEAVLAVKSTGKRRKKLTNS